MLDAMRKAPYYDDYYSPDVNGKTHADKSYTQLLAVPGRVAQAREITQIQTVMKDIIRNIGDSIFDKDGSVIEGCQVSVSTDKKYISVSAGKVYLSGMVLPVAERSESAGNMIPISGVGREVIGVRLKEEIITLAEDNTLGDPAQGHANYNQPGCDRLKSTVEILVNGEGAYPIAELRDGSLFREKYAPEYDTLTKTLAARTNDESGSYIVEGLKVRIEPVLDSAGEEDPNQFYVVVDQGKAYVNGYRVETLSPHYELVSRSTGETKEKELEGIYGIIYTGGDTTELAEAPTKVKEITKLDAQISNKEVVQSAPKPGISYNLAAGKVVSTHNLGDILVQSISDGNEPPITYEINKDYDMTAGIDGTGFSITWRREITTGYSATYNYWYTLTSGEHYEISTEGDIQYIHWLSDTRPVEGTHLNINLKYYLARKDIISIDWNGDIKVNLGSPAIYGNESIPEINSDSLPLAYIMSPPHGSASMNSSNNRKIIVSNVGLTRFTMSDIRKILDRLNTIAHDQAVSLLSESARAYNTMNDKKGIFADPLIDLSRLNLSYLTNDIKCDVAIDLDSNLCYLPILSQNFSANHVSGGKITGTTLTLPTIGEPETILEQSKATRTMQINPYSVFPQLPEISINPAVDVWLEDDIILIPRSVSSNVVVSSSTRNISSSQIRGGSFSAYTVTSSEYVDTIIGEKVVSTTVEESVVAEKAIQYIRSREITVRGSQFPPNVEGIKCYFEGYPMTLRATNPSWADARGGVKTDSLGRFVAKFVIPDRKFPAGIREVRVEVPAESMKDEDLAKYERSAFALYQASGTSRTIQRTVTTITNVLLNRITTVTSTTFIDPVGQTFVLNQMASLNSVEVYFESASDSAPVTCDIREVVDGNITPRIYGHSTLPASEVKTSRKGDVPTRFVFDDTVLLEANKEYAFVLRSSSDRYKVFVADLGGTDLISEQTVLSNPYLIGVMMSSSNNSSWTTHQTTDIKFKLLANRYEESSTAIFEVPTSGFEFSRIHLLAESVIPLGTSVRWEYMLNEDGEYLPVSPYNLLNLDSMNSTISLRLSMSRDSDSSSYVSPVIGLDTISTVLSKYDMSGGYYVSQRVERLDEYDTVDIILDVLDHSVNKDKLKVYVSNVEDVSGEDELVEAEMLRSEAIGYGWYTNEYHVDLSKLSSACTIFIKLEGDSTRPWNTPAFRRLRAIMSERIGG